MSPIQKLTLCLVSNVAVLALVVALVTVFAGDVPFWHWGWNDTLVIISVRIDTAAKYAILFAIIAVVNISRVIVEELGMPILGFSIYNPDKTVITEFTKNELQFFGNTMFIVSGLRSVFMTLVSISQIDIAIWNLIVSELASVVTIRILLNEKTFCEEGYEELKSVRIDN